MSEVKPDAPGANEAIERVNRTYRGGFQRVRETYRLNEAAVDRLGSYLEDYSVVACFADWCGDARRAIPVLALIEEKTGKKIPTLGGMTKPPPGSSEFWAVPPSPAEVKTFEVTSSPTILVFSREGHEIGRIKTRPRMMPTMEEEILKIIEDHESQAD
ncbi:MAG: thioredoxin family protein [Candidatus Thorarchaeota archaeon]